MPAVEDEVEDGAREGVDFQFLCQPSSIVPSRNKRLTVTLQETALPHTGNGGRKAPVRLGDSFRTIEVDRVVFATGETLDASGLPQGLHDGTSIRVNAFLETADGSVFAGGDAIDQPRSVAHAIASGKKAAVSIDLYLNGISAEEMLPRIRVGDRDVISMTAYRAGWETGVWPERQPVIPFEKLNTLYFRHTARRVMGRLEASEAVKDFREVYAGYSKEQAQEAAGRCFSCGACNSCNNCYFFCPEGAVTVNAAEGRRVVDYAHCKGCGTCARSCPRGVITMRAVL